MPEDKESPQNEHIDDQTFKYKVIDGLARLETKVDTLVGADGVEGRVPILEKEVKGLNKKVWTFGGSITGAGILVHYIVDLLRTKH